MGEVEIHALGGVDFSVNKGEFVIIAGASGAGKSTILNILGGMDTVSSGRVIVDNNEISKYSQKDLITYRRDDIGFVFQFYNLVQNLTARENVEVATQISKNPLNIDKVLHSVGLSDRKNNFPSQLSGGEQQRVAIARSLSTDVDLLFADEPTGNLNQEMSEEIVKIFKTLAHTHNKCIIMVTHSKEIADKSDCILTLEKGTLRRNE